MAKAAEVAIEQMDAKPEELAAPKPNRRKLIIIIVAVVALLAAAGGGAWYFLKANHDDAEEDEAPVTKTKASGKNADKGKASGDKAAKDKKPTVFMPLEVFTVNLQTDSSDRYLQTKIVFEVSDEKAVEVIKTQMPAIRSKLLLLLSSKTPTELNTPKGKEKLAEDIMAEAKKPLVFKSPDQALLAVHFDSFVIQ